MSREQREANWAFVGKAAAVFLAVGLAYALMALVVGVQPSDETPLPTATPRATSTPAVEWSVDDQCVENLPPGGDLMDCIEYAK